jgi:UDP-glucuronate 4-epimerase
VKLVEGSFLEPELVDSLLSRHAVRAVFHLGALAGVRKSFDAPLSFERANVAGTLALLEGVRRRPVERFVFASSSTVYGAGATTPFREDAPLGVPLSPYGATKQAAEALCFTYHQAFGVPIVALRPFSVYGPRVRPDLALSVFARALQEGKPIPLLGDGSMRRDFTHVDDVCGGMIAALDRPGAVGQAINLGHDEPIEVRRVIDLLAEALGKKPIIEQRPAHQGDMITTCASLDKAKKLLCYAPQVRFEEAIRAASEWFLA